VVSRSLERGGQIGFQQGDRAGEQEDVSTGLPFPLRDLPRNVLPDQRRRPRCRLVRVLENTIFGMEFMRRANSISRSLLVNPPGASAGVPAEGQYSAGSWYDIRPNNIASTLRQQAMHFGFEALVSELES
jgi:hypothetical protein